MTRTRLLCSDLDGTLLGNPGSLRLFKQVWESLPEDRRPLLCYSSGRLLRDLQALLKTGVLPRPDFLIGGVGTELYDVRRDQAVQEFDERETPGWDLAKVDQIVATVPGISKQPAIMLNSHKSSWFLKSASRRDIGALRTQLTQAGLDVKVVYSSARDLDVLPTNAGKGEALRWLTGHLDIPLADVVVAGDTANDASMFLLPEVRGIVVENAQPELHEAVVYLPTYGARHGFAEGVLEGLEHFGVIEEGPGGEETNVPADELDSEFQHMFSEESLTSLNDEERAVIAEAYKHAIIAIRKNITPLGFTACSPTDNEITGTDNNYRAVWARDSAMTIIGTFDVPDEDIRECQRVTLRTLFDHLGPNGQIPANISIDTGVADYSGIGGISAIDGGLWAVLAMYHYVRRREDWPLLREYADKVDQLMTWLHALDSNSDGLLEIPEAGDWTDLFGRSYNILADEVLWYQAVVAYGRLLEYQERFDEASDWLQRAQFIRTRILDVFWPSTHVREDSTTRSFADQQFAVGDASYLLAEITPFAFNWRCDVFGNVQAFLGNVIDIDRARTAFRFMWGVGVNEPFPAANLYPAVQAGDPDWRAYYTVNLLNLPGHYHNGGIWPFIGGMWVRFIARLGLRDVACRELLRLAHANKLGKNQEWEFNEWLHSRTGRPMGKAFQAWSASSFIHACHELHINPEDWDDN